jgi:25S rRNA (adenine2142-N1)-methyltransferase
MTNTRTGNNRRKKPIPLTRQPVIMKSRKRARQVTTQFHKLTHERERAVQQGDTTTVARLDQAVHEMGGRSEYQRASQLSTSFHSTSKWVLGSMARRGWLHGITVASAAAAAEAIPDDAKDQSVNNSSKGRRKDAATRRPTRVLEVGAINTEMLDAADSTTSTGEAKYRLDVRAIDLNSMEERIEEADFLSLPFCTEDENERYDVIVCSMVINCVPTPSDRGKMMVRLFQHLRPGGLLFLTLPKYCLTRSAFVTLAIFEQMLGRNGGVGFDVEETKQSPKVAFFVCRRPETDDDEDPGKPLNKTWTKQIIRNKGKKFPNQFSVVIAPTEVSGGNSM